MWQRMLTVVSSALLLACSSSPAKRSTPPAAKGIVDFIQVLRSDKPERAYALLSADMRERLSFEEFAIQWKESAAERKHQAAALAEGLKGVPDLDERAKMTYPDGKTVHLAREDGRWLLESPVVTRSHAGRPHDAVKLFAEALDKRDYEAVLRVLTARRRRGIADQVDSFVDSLLEHLDGAENTIETTGKDRAELRWDDDGQRYRIQLRREGDEWRVDDIHLRPVPRKSNED